MTDTPEDHQATFTVDSHGRRVWACTCEFYVSRMALYGQAFCPHIVVALAAESKADS